MKKVSLMIAALALVLGLSQCKKDEKPAASGEKQHIVLSASFGDSNSKIAEDGIGGLKWTEGDIIKVMQGQTELGTLTCKNAANGTFEGDITTATGDITFTFGEQKFTEQTGALNDAISLSATAPYDKNGNYDVTMTMPHAVLKLDLSAFADDTKGAGVMVTITSGEVTLASVTGITANSKAVYVALPADGTGSKKYTFSNGNGMNAEKTWPLEANTFYTKNGSTTGEAIVIELDAPAAPDGALSGLFTIDDYGTKVYFSKGNLQYHTTNKTWRFADSQYALLDNNPSNHTTTNYGENTDKWIDLFGWGTSGYDHNLKSYQPWSTSQTSSDYYAYGDQYKCLYDGEGEMKGKADWGANAISNGGGSTWRTLTGGSNGEWNYLINTRKVNGETGYGHTCVLATLEEVGVNGEDVYGLIIFHDDYKGTTSGLTSIPDGCVFLPAAGNRNGTSVGNVGSNGYYWSSSYSSENNARRLGFYDGSVYPSGSNDRYYGFSVRLVSVK